MITVETYRTNPNEILEQISDDIIKDYCYKNNIIEKPDNYTYVDKYRNISIQVEVNEDDCLDEMWESDIVEYAKNKQLIELDDFYDEVLDNLTEDDLFNNLIYVIKRTNKSVITKEDIIKYINEKLKYDLR